MKGQHKALPLKLPEIPVASAAKPVAEAKPGDAFILKPGEALPKWADPVQPILSVSANETRLFSLSGSEGTAAQPKARWTKHDPDAVAAAVAEIVTRRFSERRPQEAHTIMIIAGPKVAAQQVADIVDAVRPSFPNVVLGGGNF